MSKICAICLEDEGELDLVAQDLSCGHWYHRLCISKWLVIKQLCPTCKAPVSDEEAGPLVDDMHAAVLDAVSAVAKCETVIPWLLLFTCGGIIAVTILSGLFPAARLDGAAAVP